MRALVVYESMYGNTRHIAEAIAEGLGGEGVAKLVPVAEAADLDVVDCDLLVVGGPTHVHGMSRESTRHEAEEAAMVAADDLPLEPNATLTGVRDWLESLPERTGRAVAFDTRVDAMPLLTGRASKGITKLLRRAGYEIVADPESFLVDKETHLIPGEQDRARRWGETLSQLSSSRV